VIGLISTLSVDHGWINAVNLMPATRQISTGGLTATRQHPGSEQYSAGSRGQHPCTIEPVERVVAAMGGSAAFASPHCAGREIKPINVRVPASAARQLRRPAQIDPQLDSISPAGMRVTSGVKEN
jgi:hypothetical protein